MGLLERTFVLRRSFQEGRGLAARANHFLDRHKSRGVPEGNHVRDPVAQMIAEAPGPSVMLSYDITGMADPGFFENTARKVVEGNGAVRRTGNTALYVILYHMETADPKLILDQFGVALVRMGRRTWNPPAGYACRVKSRT